MLEAFDDPFELLELEVLDREEAVIPHAWLGFGQVCATVANTSALATAAGKEWEMRKAQGFLPIRDPEAADPPDEQTPDEQKAILRSMFSVGKR